MKIHELPAKWFNDISLKFMFRDIPEYKTMFSILALRVLHYFIALGVLVKQWIFRFPALSFKKSDNLTIQSDARQLKKLPLHLGMLFLEDNVSYSDIANAILWAVAVGISYISIYDMCGTLKRNEKTLYDAIEKRRSYQLDSESTKADIHLHSTIDSKDKCNSSSYISVYLLSLEDGRQSVVDTARSICKRVTMKEMSSTDITPQSVDNLFQDKFGCPDPDLVIRFGSVESLMGFMPWQVRLTEIISLPTHYGLNYKTFHRALTAYGNTQQRFGK